MKRTKILALLIVFGGMFGAVFGGGQYDVFADSGSGNSGTADTSKSCNTANFFVTNVCKDNNKKTGGASWHIFKTKDTSKVWTNYGLYKRRGGPYYCKGYDAHEESGCSTFGPLSSGGYDKNLATNCPKSKYDYYAIYVADGWFGRENGNKKNVVTYFGPLAWEMKYSGVSFSYNTTDAMAWSTLKDKLVNNEEITDSQKITAGAAKQLCKADTGDGPCKTVTTADIPKGTGYICVSYPHNVTLTAYARDVNGNVLNDGNIIDSDTISVLPRGSGETSVNIIGITDYVFKGWREIDSTDGDYASTSNVFTKVISENTSVYAYYERVADEEPDFSAESTLEIKVANSTLKVNDYGRLQTGTVYAKPGDELVFETTYHSGAQTGINQTPNRISIDGGEEKISSNSGTETLQQMFNNYPGNYGQWSNGFTVMSKNFISPYRETYNLGVGEKLDTKDRNTHIVSSNEVGGNKVLEEVASTLKNEAGIGTAPYKVEITKAGLGKVSTGLEKKATVIVPYNFTIDVTIGSFDDDDDDEPESYGDDDVVEGSGSPNEGNNSNNKTYEAIPAGEEKSISAEIQVGNKPNRLTTDNPDEEEYSTKADEITQSLIWYIPSESGERKSGGVQEGNRGTNLCETSYFQDGVGGCYKGEEYSGINLESGEKRTIESKINIPDEPAGTNLCVAMAVFPADSGSDGNYSTSNYSELWRISKSKCYTIAKRPSLRILGGNVYSSGAIKTGLSVKKNLQGHEGGDPYIFGSWGELGVISSGRVDGFASGATIGNPLGYHGKKDYCKLSPLSFANENCGDNYSGNIGTSNALSGINADKDAIENFVNKFKGNGEKGEYNDNDTLTIAVGDTASYYHSNGTLNVGASTIGAGAIKVIHASNININGDINYEDTTYTNLEQIPKLVIYAEENIVIDCSVGRVDALLLAGTVKTCNSDDINKWANSQKQLSIRGAVLTSQLIANRAYGAATGDNSIISAEEINFDPTLYLWGGNDSDKVEGSGINDEMMLTGNDLEMVYVRDIPPRY